MRAVSHTFSLTQLSDRSLNSVTPLVDGTNLINPLSFLITAGEKGKYHRVIPLILSGQPRSISVQERRAWRLSTTTPETARFREGSSTEETDQGGKDWKIHVWILFLVWRWNEWGSWPLTLMISLLLSHLYHISHSSQSHSSQSHLSICLFCRLSNRIKTFLCQSTRTGSSRCIRSAGSNTDPSR